MIKAPKAWHKKQKKIYDVTTINFGDDGKPVSVNIKLGLFQTSVRIVDVVLCENENK